MKKAIIITLIFLVSCSPKFKERFSFSPQKPKVGDKITVRYNPEKTRLQQAEQIDMMAYEFSATEMSAKDVALKKKRGGWEGEFKPDSSTLLIVVQFQADNIIEDNGHEGYKILLCDESGNYRPGALAILAKIHSRPSYPLRLNRNYRMALDTLKYEFAQHPEQRALHRELYWNLILKTNRKYGKNIVLSQLDSIASLPTLTLDDKKLLADWYAKLDLDDKAEIYKKEIRAAEPRGFLVQSERSHEFFRARDFNKKYELYKKFLADFPESSQLKGMTMMMLKALIDAGQYDRAQEFLEKVAPAPTASNYNSLAWTLVEKEINLKTAADLARKGVDLARKALEAPLTEKPSYLTEKQWRKEQRYTLGIILDTYAFALYKLHELPDAAKYFKEATELTEKRDVDIDTRYTRVLLDLNKNEQALEFLKTLFAEGKGSSQLNNLFRRAYVAVHGSASGFDTIMAKYRNEDLKKLHQKLEKEMLNEKAPDFTLTDLEGKTVTLSKLAGKTVVLDFWATWCNPCIRSFPVMQKAVNRFKDDDNVRFLFINTAERGEKKEIRKKVAEFIKKNNYSFQVLLDNEKKVMSDYKVDGIPTKFVIDRQGNIRFKSVGFSGNANKILEELSMMIEMAQ